MTKERRAQKRLRKKSLDFSITWINHLDTHPTHWIKVIILFHSHEIHRIQHGERQTEKPEVYVLHGDDRNTFFLIEWEWCVPSLMAKHMWCSFLFLGNCHFSLPIVKIHSADQTEDIFLSAVFIQSIFSVVNFHQISSVLVSCKLRMHERKHTHTHTHSKPFFSSTFLACSHYCLTFPIRKRRAMLFLARWTMKITPRIFENTGRHHLGQAS